ncbi:MAG: metallophosphoesterase [Gracilimonas sp.]|jgi:UDP-2,3-diacylglucosamine pyrophosphatase LpxH|uniref:UDP-2,3-diacylglucosamine diphosphatase n=1 Tax=Gracilimonas sp. TaxID=1974203 RepID=UPI0037515C84|nr:metallophosphoesterase [Gracilimonas sp.]
MSFEQHLFISDVHLGAFSSNTNQQIERDLITLIEHCKKERIEINILGDLFDYWMEYPEKGFIPDLGRKVLDAFEEYNRTVTPALFITGNHDNWTFGHFNDRGFDLESNFRLKEIAGKRFLLMHGDGVAAAKIDFPRAAFHKLLRNDTFVRTYQKILSPELGLAAMKAFSSLTRRRDSHNPEPLNRQAKKIFNKHNLDYIISGHDHVPRMETFSRGSYINLGTFFNHRTMALYNNTGLSLVTWKASSKNFIPFE